MAVTITHLTHQNQAGAHTSFTTASFTPGANSLIICVVHTIPGSGTANTPTMSGNGLTWVQVATYLLSVDATRRITIFRAMGASPSTGAATIDFGGQSQFTGYWTIEQFDGINTTGTNGSGAVVQTAENDNTGTQTGITVTLGAFAQSANATFGFLIRNSAAAVTVGSGFTDVNQVTGGDGTIDSEFKNTTDTTVDWTWASVSAQGQAVAIEIAAPTVVSASGSYKTLLGAGQA